MWFSKIPPRIKVFLGLASRNSKLSKDYLLHRGKKRTDNCMYCGRSESVNHLLFYHSLANYCWNIFNCSFHTNMYPSSFDDLYSWIRQDTTRFSVEGGRMITAAIVWSRGLSHVALLC